MVGLGEDKMIKRYIKKVRAKEKAKLSKYMLNKLSDDLFFGHIYNIDDEYWSENIAILEECSEFLDLGREIELYKAHYELYKEKIKSKII